MRAVSQKKRNSTASQGILLLIILVFCIFPFYWMVTTSLKDQIVALQTPPAWVFEVTFGNYTEVLFKDGVWENLLNSLIIAVCTTFLSIFLGCPAAFALARFEFRGKKDLWFWFITNRMVSPIVLALPFLVLYKELALLDTRIGLIALYTLTVLPIVIWIMRDQFSSIPTELEEAALVDGLSIWGAFLTIILPIALPGMVASFIISLVLTWNEYFFAALLTSSYAKTLPVMVASQTGSQGISWWSMAALSLAAILPLIIIAIILERYIIKGMAAGAVK